MWPFVRGILMHLNRVVVEMGPHCRKKAQTAARSLLFFKKYFFNRFIFLKWTQCQCILSFDNSTAMY
jgi:hypothetical protein